MSANQLTLNGTLKSADDYLAKAQSLPQNASADGNGGSFESSDTQGSLQVIAEVNSQITLADTKTLGVKIQQSKDNGVSDAFADLETLYSLTSDGGSVIAAGTELGRFVIPTNAERYIKAVLTTDDAAAAGKVDLYVDYIPR